VWARISARHRHRVDGLDRVEHGLGLVVVTVDLDHDEVGADAALRSSGVPSATSAAADDPDPVGH
jgi:hypothetical protein